jgi:fused signal recognition particle receptor
MNLSNLNIGEISAIVTVAFIFISSLPNLLSQKSQDKKADKPIATLVTKVEIKAKPEVELKPELNVEVEKEVTVSFFDRLKKGLSKSRSEVWDKIGSLLNSDMDDERFDQIEELLFSSDMSASAVDELLEALKEKVKTGGDSFNTESFKQFVFEFLKNKMVDIQDGVNSSLYSFDKDKKGPTKVIMVVGVNGAGKTTTIGKLATKLKNQGASVYVGACDTFRAAAIEQLEAWCDRAGVNIIKAKHGSDPSGVAYETLETAINEKADYCILDTAGRLHTASNLMEELSKTKRVLSKLAADAPDEVLLVIDAITGQNAMRQAEEFNKALSLTGLIFTKCDGSAKAGSAVSIVDTLKVPIAYIGVGESVEDLSVFNLDDYLKALIDV